jgi:hypothetical protein
VHKDSQPSIGGTVVVVIEGFVFTATCTMNVFVHVYRRNCCSRNRRVCIYNNMYNECLCTLSIGGTVVVVIVGFVFTTTCTMNVFVTVPAIDGVQRHSLYMLL